MQRWKYIAGLLLFQTISGLSSPAQTNPYVFRHLSTENGLLSNRITNIYQDSRGYIWLCSTNGLQRYDGNRFVNYQTNLKDSQALHSVVLYRTFEDSRHRFWVGDNGNVYLMNRSNGTFYNFNLHLPPHTAPYHGAGKFIEDAKGDIWFYNQESFYKHNEQTGLFEDYGKILGITPAEKPDFFDKDDQGNLWMVTTVSVKYYDVRKNILYNKTHNPGKHKIFDIPGETRSFLVSGDNIWYGYMGPRILYRYNLNSRQTFQYIIQDPEKNEATRENGYFDNKIDNLTLGADGSFTALLTGEGIARYDKVKDSFDVITINNMDPNGLHADVDRFEGVATLTDRERNIWITGNKGLNIFNPTQRQFYFYGISDPGKPTDPAPYTVNDFIQSPIDGDIYVCYYHPAGGIVRFNADLQFKKRYLFNKNGTMVTGENEIWCMYLDDKGVIWAPNQAGSILKLDTKTEKLSLDTDTTEAIFINTLQRDTGGNLWMGTWSHGLRRSDPSFKNIVSYITPPAGSTIIPKNITALCFSGDSLVWAGCNGQGLLKFDRRKNAFTRQYLFNEQDKTSISSNVIYRILDYNPDTLLVATSMGINLFDKKKETFVAYTARNGFPSNITVAMEPDEHKNLWIACQDGFCKMNMHDLSITNYGPMDGIANYVFNNVPVLKLKDGRYLFSGVKGFMAFRPGDIANGSPPPSPVITGFRVFDKERSVDSIVNAGKALKLSYKNNSIAIDFASLQFNFSDNLRYYYRMEGISPEWIAAGTEQTAHFNQLRPGNYTFSVKCINRDGLEGQSQTKLFIRILPPIWQTWWFRAGVVLLLAILFYYLLRWQQKKREEKEQLRVEYERKIAAVEMNALRAQMNPHFIFNSLNSINTFILKNDTENATEYLHKFSTLVRLILDNSRNEWILLENELKALELYIELEALRFENVFDYTIKLGPGIKTSSVWIPPLIIQPYAENAIRHGLVSRDKPGGHLAIDVWKENGELKIQVTDNGIGRAAAGKIKKQINKLHLPSHGMKITAERLDIVNDVYDVNAKVEVTDLNEPGNTGTRVQITIQYRDDAGNNH